MGLTIVPAGTITPYVFHRFREHTLAALATNAADMDEVGKAKFHFELGYDHANGLLTQVRLTMRLRIGMPVWQHRNGRPQAERDEWDRFLRALRHHEDGHIDIFRAEAPTAYEVLVQSTPSAINDDLEAERQRIQGLSDAYDVRTGNGRTQQTPDGNTVITVP